MTSNSRQQLREARRPVTVASDQRSSTAQLLNGRDPDRLDVDRIPPGPHVHPNEVGWYVIDCSFPDSNPFHWVAGPYTTEAYAARVYSNLVEQVAL